LDEDTHDALHQAKTGAVTLIQCFDGVLNLNMHLTCGVTQLRFSLNFLGSPAIESGKFVKFQGETPVNTTMGSQSEVNGSSLDDDSRLKYFKLT